jgi:8-hydroxy-5-deazaflavin:NADPH oxidoreductase
VITDRMKPARKVNRTKLEQLPARHEGNNFANLHDSSSYDIGPALPSSGQEVVVIVCMHEPGWTRAPQSSRTAPSPPLRRVPLTTKSVVVGDLIMTNHRVENDRRNFLLTIAGSIAGLAVGPARAQPAAGAALRISTIGAGREGGALGALFVKAGHRVMFSSRHPDTLKGLVDELGSSARAGTVAEAVEFGDVVMVVVPYTAMEQIGKDHGNALAKKALVIDVSNPIARRDGAEIVKWVDEQGGAGLATAKLLPGAHIVRAFNAINYAKLSADVHRQGELVGVPIAGDDPQAIDIASGLIREIGFDPVLIGGLAMGKYLVPGTPLGGEQTAAEIRQIVTNLH